MGRGPGGLQRWMLCKARAEQKRADEPLTYAEIKVQHFRLPLIRTTRGGRGWKFERRKLKKYNAASAAISRAAHRLEDLGLITIIRTAVYAVSETPSRAEIRLTPKGVTAAESLAHQTANAL